MAEGEAGEDRFAERDEEVRVDLLEGEVAGPFLVARLPGGVADQDAGSLLEETGHRAGRLELLGRLRPDVGRLGNSMWCFLAADVEPAGGHVPEPDVEPIT